MDFDDVQVLVFGKITGFLTEELIEPYGSKYFYKRYRESIEINVIGEQKWNVILDMCHMQVHPSGNYIPVVISSPNYTSLPSMVATFLATCLVAVLKLSKYSVFHGGDTPIQLGLP